MVYRSTENKKIGLDNLSRVGLQLPKADDVSDPINRIYQKSENVNTPLKAHVDELRKAGRTDDEIIETLEKQGVNPYEAMEAVDGDVDLNFKEEVKKANSYTIR